MLVNLISNKSRIKGNRKIFLNKVICKIENYKKLK